MVFGIFVTSMLDFTGRMISDVWRLESAVVLPERPLCKIWTDACHPGKPSSWDSCPSQVAIA